MATWEDMQDESFQPTHITFPLSQFGISSPVNRSFQAAWFNRLHYDIGKDAAYSFVCCKAVKKIEGWAIVVFRREFPGEGIYQLEGFHQDFYQA